LTDKIEVPTPFGAVNIPFPKLPSLEDPKMDERRSKALGHAVGEDLSMIIALVPLVGDIVADVLEDLHASEIKKVLSPSEFDTYMENNKVAPSAIAMLRTFMEK
jgi:hypothetical protein